MKIIVDKEGEQAMKGLLDCAMRQGGLGSLDVVNAIRAGIVVARDGEHPTTVTDTMSEKPADGVQEG